MAKLILKDGTSVEGTGEELAAFANRAKDSVEFGPYGNVLLYKSESRGLIPIKGMNKYHLRNAMCKIYREWVSTLNNLEPDEFMTSLELGVTDQTFLAMFNELYNQVEDSK